MAINLDQERTMSISLKEIIVEFQDSMKQLAVKRCTDMLDKLEKRRGCLGDSDYVPESQSQSSGSF